MKKRALISGVSGQDGRYLSELLLHKGYEVHGIVRRSSSPNTSRIDHLREDLILHMGDVTDQASLDHIVDTVQPHEVYNLAAQSQVRLSFDIPEYTMQVTGGGTLRLLTACKNFASHARFYQASTSELFGDSPAPQHEQTPFRPRSPYGCAKAFAFYTTRNFREAYGMYAVNGILFNHESEHRGPEFVSRKITQAAARIRLGLQVELRLGNLQAQRDWGHASDYVRAMWLMLQQEENEPVDFVIGTGVTHTVEDFLTIAFSEMDLDWKRYVVIDPTLYRPSEVNVLRADAKMAQDYLNWFPEYDFETLVKRMVRHDLALEMAARRQATP